MKKLILIGAVLIIIILNSLVANSSYSLQKAISNPHVFKTAYARGGANCWSQTKYEENSSVLRCVTCDWKEDSTGDGRHDGKCPGQE